MVIVKLFVDVKVYQGLTLKKNNQFVMSRAVMRQLMKFYPGGVIEGDDFDKFYHKLSLKNLKAGDEVFLFRSGGIGDVMFMLPLARFLKENYHVKVKIGTSPMYCDVLLNNPYVDKIVQMPFNLTELIDSDYHLIFEGIIEDSSERAATIHSVDLFFDEAGVNFKKINNENKIPKIFLSEEERESGFLKIEKLVSGRTDYKMVGFQIEASSPIRSFPLEKIVAVMKELISSNIFVFAFGGKRQETVGEHLSAIFDGYDLFVNLIPLNFSLRESVVLANFMDVIVAPDSAFIHIAGGLGIPVVGLYGCFPSLLRMRYYNNAIGLDCRVSCAPSFIHGHNPCPKGVPSPCFSVIKPEDVLNAIYHILGIKDIKLNYPVFNEFFNGELKPSPFSVIKNG